MLEKFKKTGILLAAALVLAVLLAAVAPAPISARAAGHDEVAAADGAAADQASAMEAKKNLQRGDPGFWSYALSTLIIRFVGIFVVLGILQGVIHLQGRIFTAYEARKKAGAAKAS